MNRTTLVELTADIASAHVSHNSVAVSDLPGLIKRVHDSLAGLSGPKLEANERSAPIVSVKASVRPDYLVCLRCGTKKKMLKRHLSTAHGYTPGEYRSEYGLAASYPMVSSNHSKVRSSLARAFGLGTKEKSRKGTRVKSTKGSA
jgi:predicted transcriptional regulator